MTFVWITSYLFIFVMGGLVTISALFLSKPKTHRRQEEKLDETATDTHLEIEELEPNFAPTILTYP